VRTTVIELVRDLARGVALPDPVFEFGARRAEGQEHLPAIASLFPSARFVGCDLLPGPGVDEVEDLHALSFADGSIGTALLLDTIEHVREPWRALLELHRCLAPGGILVMTSVMFFPVHAHPDDYWRFTESGFQVLVDGFEPLAVRAVGYPDLPHTVVAIAAKDPVDAATKHAVAEVVDRWAKHGATSWKEHAMLWLPPRLVAPGYRAFRRLMTRRSKGRST
jgi:SAM-dependent methyltransferase